MIELEYKKTISKSVIAFIVVITLFFGIKFLSEMRSYGSMGSQNVNTITLSGHGEVQAIPDIATITFSIRNEAKTVKEAQDLVATTEKKALDFLKENKIAEKDIKTTNASFYPKYEYKYERSLVPCNEYGCPPQNGKNVIIGYEASENITVKVRNTDDAGVIIQGLGTIGVSDLNGPNFAIDDEDGLKAQARKLAIEEAKTKAEALAKDLGVKLGRIASFNESGSYYPVPMYAKMESSDAMMANGAPAELPKGENTISSDVTITYEIR